MSDPCLFTLQDAFPDHEFDPHYLEQGLAAGAKHCAAHVPDLYAEATATLPAVQQWVRALAEATVRGMRSHVPAVRTGPSLLLLGTTGVGKTHQAYGALRAIAASGLTCGWTATTAADIYAAMRPRPKVDSEAVFTRFAEAQLLLVDDLGAAKPTEWNEEVNYRLINTRYQHRLPTIITSNLLANQLNERLGSRVFSRLAEMCKRVTVPGDDRRRKPATTNTRSEV